MKLEIDKTKAEALFEILLQYLFEEHQEEYERNQRKETLDERQKKKIETIRAIFAGLLREMGWKDRVSEVEYKAIGLQREKI